MPPGEDIESGCLLTVRPGGTYKISGTAKTPRRERHLTCLVMEEYEEIGPPVQRTSKLGLRSRIAALPIWVKVGLIVALTVVVAYWVYSVLVITINLIGEGLGL